MNNEINSENEEFSDITKVSSDLNKEQDKLYIDKSIELDDVKPLDVDTIKLPSIFGDSSDIKIVAPENQTNDDIKEEVVFEQEKKDNVSNITFDYNSIYGNKVNSKEEEINDTKEDDKFKVQDINVSMIGKDSSVTPEFNSNVLNGKDEQTTKIDNSILDKKDQNRADTIRKVLYIGIITLIIILSIKLLFPILAGYK